ncbi:MAG: SIS domain-containing protein [Actinomycetota bacterium]|jgi:fructoselysine-6-P-deglycase FrlB-like protein|nr:SIS domain-containing protein [Actinomycetota bacterium]
MTYIENEIASQPDMWRRAAALVTDTATSAGLPRSGERVALVGCGTSLFMAQTCAVLRESLGRGETDAFAASDFPRGRRYDRVIGITRSGTTTEVVQLLEAIGQSQPTTVVTTQHDLPVERFATHTVHLDFADEVSVVQTRFATSVLALWRAHLGVDLEPVILDAYRALAAEVPEEWLECREYTFLGSGWATGIAYEAALKVREASQSWTESYSAMEFRHGPISVLDQRSLAFFFGDVPEGLLAQVEATGAATVVSDLDPMAQLVIAQRLAAAVALHRGLNPDEPRNLTRSIILSEHV